MPKQNQNIKADPVQRVNCFLDCAKEFKEPEPGKCTQPDGRIITPYPTDECRIWDTRRRNHNQDCRLRCGAALPSDIRDVELRRAFGSGGPSPKLPNQ